MLPSYSDDITAALAGAQQQLERANPWDVVYAADAKRPA
jgi:hypothetical protein